MAKRNLHTNMMIVLEEAGRYIACHRSIWKATFQILLKAYNTDVIAILLGFMEQFLGAMLEIEF